MQLKSEIRNIRFVGAGINHEDWLMGHRIDHEIDPHAIRLT